MAVAGYGVEATVESIWDHAWATARFDFINIAIGTRFNFWITGIAQTDITDTSVAALLAVETNDMFSYWNALAKIEKTTQPWDFISLWFQNHFQGDGFRNYFRDTIKKCQELLGHDAWEMSNTTLPSASNKTWGS